MPRSVNEIKIIDLAAQRFVLQRSGLRLNGDSAFSLEIHGVQHLSLHFAVRKSAAKLYEAIRESRLAVIDVSNY